MPFPITLNVSSFTTVSPVPKTDAEKNATSNIIADVGLYDKYDGAHFFKVFSKNHGLRLVLDTVDAAIFDSSPAADLFSVVTLGSLPLLRCVSCFLNFVLSKFSESDMIVYFNIYFRNL